MPLWCTSILETKSRCVILDPNADFRRVNEVEPDSLWESAEYDLSGRKGRLPHERSRQDFLARWSQVLISIQDLDCGVHPYERISFSLPSLSLDTLDVEVRPMLRIALIYCHDFARALATVLSFGSLILAPNLI